MRTLWTSVASLSAVLVIGIGGVGLAPAASAAEVDVTIDCQGPVTVTGQPGDTVVFTMASPACDTFPNPWYIYDWNGVLGQDLTAAGFLTYVSQSSGRQGVCQNYCGREPHDWYATGDGGPPFNANPTITAVIAATDGLGNPLVSGDTLGVVNEGAEDYRILFQSSSEPTAIPMWQQAIGRPSATATCPDGYTPSWDTWPNNHTGGYVCNRFVPAYGN